ncbi:hypothetical protein PC116_g31850, partial [Phytophthora cactorum]
MEDLEEERQHNRVPVTKLENLQVSTADKQRGHRRTGKISREARVLPHHGKEHKERFKFLILGRSVEDAALGFLADTEARTKTRTSKCTDANVDDAKILARIEGPSFDDPFRFLGVKWLTLSTPGAAKYFIKSRDYLILESSGMALDSDGERFCYLLSHSIALDEVPEFESFGFARQTFSACHIIRPSDTEREVKVFSRGFTDSVGKLTERL